MSSYGPDPGVGPALSRGLTQCGHAVEKKHCIEGLSGSRKVGWQEEAVLLFRHPVVSDSL